MTNPRNDAALAMHIEEEFRPHLPSAIARFQYLYPGLDVTAGVEITISGVGDIDPSIVRRDFRYVLYREKIHAENADARAALLGALLK